MEAYSEALERNGPVVGICRHGTVRADIDLQRIYLSSRCHIHWKLQYFVDESVYTQVLISEQ